MEKTESHRRYRKKTLENKAKFDHLVDNEKTADAINAFFINTVTSAAKPLMANRTERRGGVG